VVTVWHGSGTKQREGGYFNKPADKFVETGKELDDKEGYCKRIEQ